MKPTLLLLILSSGLTAQVTTRVTAEKTTAYYDWNWKRSDSAHARFVTLLEHTDSGWRRLNYYVQGPVIQMEGWYEDSACNTPSGKFVYGYPDKTVKSTGRYVHGKKQGLWLTWHPNGMVADSTVYEADQPAKTIFRRERQPTSRYRNQGQQELLWPEPQGLESRAYISRRQYNVPLIL